MEAVNNSRTKREHNDRQQHLWGWREAMRVVGYDLDMCAADMHYIDQGVDRPMCCGVWNDWKPLETDARKDG